MNTRAARMAGALCLASLCVLVACRRSEPAPPNRAQAAFEALVSSGRAKIAAYPSMPLARGELALMYEANRHWGEAAEHYRVARMLDPKNPHWALHAALCAAEAGELERAKREIELAAASFPESAPILQHYGVSLLEDGDADGAREVFTALASLAPDAPEAWTGLAEAALAQADATGALQAAERALALDPGYGLPRYVRGLSLRELGRGEESIQELERAGTGQRRMLGDDWSLRGDRLICGREARFDRGVALLASDRAAAARDLFAKLVREHPDDVRSLGNLAMAQASLGELDAALRSCDRALGLEPASAPLLAARARILLGLQRAGEAVEAAQRAILLEPHKAEHRVVLAGALRAAGRAQEAGDAWREAVRLDPSLAGHRDPGMR